LEIYERLQQEFPNLCLARTQLFAYRQAISTLLGKLKSESAVNAYPIKELQNWLTIWLIVPSANHRNCLGIHATSTSIPLANAVNVVIVQAHYLTWFELMLAGLDETCLIRDAADSLSHHSSTSQTFLADFHIVLIG